MSEKLSPYTPMSEAKTARVDSTGATLPFHLQERVGLNTKYLTTLMQIGGIGTLKIVSDNNGETSKTSATMVGFTRNGEAYAGKAKIDSVPSSNHNLTDINSPDPKQSSWPKLNLTLNIPEMKQRILRSPMKEFQIQKYGLKIYKKP